MPLTDHAPEKTFGALRFDSGEWVISAQPDIRVRLKRIFPRVRATALGDIHVLDSPEVARDLEWVLGRWPMNISDLDVHRLRSGADAHREQEDAVTQILAGTAKHAEMPLEPDPSRALRDYQHTAHDMMVATGRLLLADDLGLGKTVSSLAALSDPANRPMLAVVLNGLQRQWLREAQAMFPDLRGIEAKKAKPYDLSDDEGREPDLIVMNYAKLAGWADHLAGKVNSVVFDEVQELRRDGTQKHLAAQQVSLPARIVAGCSATPVFNYGGEMHSILSVLSPDLAGNRGEFAREWCDSTYGLDTKTRISDPAAFRQWMIDQGVFLRRTREEVGVSLPALTVQEYDIDVDSEAWKNLLDTSDAARIAELVLSEDSTHRQRWRASGELDYRMRLATGMAKAPHVVSVAKLILESEEKILLAGWHRSVWDLWQEQLAEYKPVLYTGTESTAAKQRSFEAFTEGDSRILMLSLRSGAGLDGLQGSCNVALFGELDWSPGVHKQLLGRLHRPGQQNPVTGYFCVSDYGADPLMLDALDLKRIETDLIVNGPSPSLEYTDATTHADRLRLMAEGVLSASGAGRKRP